MDGKCRLLSLKYEKLFIEAIEIWNSLYKNRIEKKKKLSAIVLSKQTLSSSIQFVHCVLHTVYDCYANDIGYWKFHAIDLIIGFDHRYLLLQLNDQTVSNMIYIYRLNLRQFFFYSMFCASITFQLHFVFLYR